MTQRGLCLIRDPVRADVYECIRAHPDISTKDIVSILPEHSEDAIKAAVRRLNGIMIYAAGRDGNGRTWRVYR